MFGRLIVILLGLAGGAGVSQAPEIATQYQQRLGGAIDELTSVINRFDEDAAQNNLNREEAIQKYQESSESFLNDRGQSMRVALQRHDNLTEQVTGFSQTNDLMKPFYLATRADQELLTGVMEDYSAGVPGTTGGLVYGGLGVLFGCLVGWILRLPFRRRSNDVRISH